LKSGDIKSLTVVLLLTNEPLKYVAQYPLASTQDFEMFTK